MTNPTKGQTPTAEELLKEAAETIDQLLCRFDKTANNTWDRKSILEGIRTKGLIDTFLSSSVPPALTWEQAFDTVIKNKNLDQLSALLKSDLGPLPSLYKEVGILFMEANRLQRWIQVKERLPENMTYVLIIYDGSHREIAEYKHGCFWIGYGKLRPTHWQPLPEVPKQ